MILSQQESVSEMPPTWHFTHISLLALVFPRLQRGGSEMPPRGHYTPTCLLAPNSVEMPIGRHFTSVFNPMALFLPTLQWWGAKLDD